MGGVYYNTDPNATGNQVLNNKIHDVSDASALDADGYAGQGIYLDENTSSALVENNLVYRTSAVGQAQTCGRKPRACPTRLRTTFLPTDVWAPSRKAAIHRLRESCNLLSPTT